MLFLLSFIEFSRQFKENGLQTAFYVHFLIILVFGLIFSILYYILNQLVVRSNTPKNNTSGILGEHELTIDQEWITDKTCADETKFKWSSSPNVIVKKKYLIIFKTEYSALFIPLSSFASMTEFDDFYSQVVSFWKKAQQNSHTEPRVRGPVD